MLHLNTINNILSDFEPIELQEVASARLMDRVDSKYVTHVSKAIEFLSLLKDDFYIQIINGNYLAKYITVYYDTNAIDYYRHHQTGRMNRQKIRVRNYSDTQTAFVEVKNKNNKGRTSKIRVSCLPDKEIQLNQFDDFITDKCLFSSEDLSPHVQNTFLRVTLLNKQRTERLTIDFDLSFQNKRTNFSSNLHHLGLIELKQQGHMHSKAKEILRLLGIKSKGLSKYCVGCALTNPMVSTNNIKRKINYINKLREKNDSCLDGSIV